MKLYYFETPNPRKPCAVAKYLGSLVEFVKVDVSKGEQKNPAFLAVNPNGKVPALQDGDVKLWEGHAIMAYLAHRAGSDLWPSDPVKQIEILKWLNWDTAHFSRHAGRLLFNTFIKPNFGLGDPGCRRPARSAPVDGGQAPWAGRGRTAGRAVPSRARR